MLTNQQKADVRRALGWSAQYAQTDNKLEGAFDGLSTQPEHEAQVIEILADIVDLKDQLKSAWRRLKAVKVGSIELETLKTEIGGLRYEGMRLTGELAAIMGVERRHNIFGSGSPERTSWYGPVPDSNFIG